MSACCIPQSCDSLQSQNILIFGGIERGFGDISATVRIAEILKKHFPKNNFALTLRMGEDQYDQLSLFTKNLTDIKIIKYTRENEFYDAIKEFNPSYMVSFHVPNLKNQDTFVIQQDEMPDFTIPCINFEEYNYNNWRTFKPFYQEYSLGLSEEGLNADSVDGLGLFQEDQLIKYYQDPSNQNSLHRLCTYLPQLHPNLFAAVVGADKDHSFPIQQMTDFDLTHSLYFGYVNGHTRLKFQRIFAGAIAENPRVPASKNLVMIYPGISSIAKLSKEKFIDFLREKGFARLEIIEWNGGSKAVPGRFSIEPNQYRIKASIDLTTTPEGEKNRRVMRIITGRFCHDDFIHLMQASEKEVLSTGDQSLGEALTAGKEIYYETNGHKDRLTRELAKLISTICQKEISFHYSNVLKTRGSFAERIRWMGEHFAKLHDNWDKVIQEIHAHQNCESNIVNKLLGLHRLATSG